jgi:hypothetical protein
MYRHERQRPPASEPAAARLPDPYEGHEETGDEPSVDLPPVNLRPELASMTLSELEAGVRAIDDATAADDLLLWLGRASCLLWRAKRLKADLEARVVAWIGAHGDLVAGEVRYTTGHHAITRCVDVTLGVEALLAAAGGKPAGLAAYLKSDPFKYGSCRSVLTPSQYRRVFRTEVKVELREGVPVRQLKRVNDRFGGRRRNYPDYEVRP